MFDSKALHLDNQKLAGAVTGFMEGWTDTFRRKNRNYGNSWLLTGETLALWFPSGLQVDSVKKQIILGLITRMLDKIIRAAHIELQNVPDLVNEDSSESFFDLGVYAFMAGSASFIGRMEKLEAAVAKVVEKLRSVKPTPPGP